MLSENEPAVEIAKAGLRRIATAQEELGQQAKKYLLDLLNATLPELPTYPGRFKDSSYSTDEGLLLEEAVCRDYICRPQVVLERTGIYEIPTVRSARLGQTATTYAYLDPNRKIEITPQRYLNYTDLVEQKIKEAREEYQTRSS